MRIRTAWTDGSCRRHLPGDDLQPAPAVCDDVEVTVALLDMTADPANRGAAIAIEKIELAVEKVERGFARQLDTLLNLEPESRNWALSFELSPPEAVACPVGMTVRLLNASGEPVETRVVTVVNNHFSSQFGSTP